MSSNTFTPCNHTICLSIYFTKRKTNCTSLLNLLRKSGNYTFKELIYCKYYMRLVSKLLGLGVLFKIYKTGRLMNVKDNIRTEDISL